MATTGRSLTRHFAIESRQHELLGFDLGEGLPRRALWVGLIAFPIWWLILWAVMTPFTDHPVNAMNLILWLLPPTLLVWFGMQASPRTPRRRAMTDWLLTLRYAAVGHQSIIRLGARRPTRQERLSWRKRLAGIAGWRRLLAEEAMPPAWAAEAEATSTEVAPTQRAIVLHQTARVLSGPELLGKLTKRKKVRP